MIRPATTPTRQQVRKQARTIRKRQESMETLAQMTTNAVLWRIIDQQERPLDEDDNPVEGPMVLMVPHEELKSVPANFGLQVDQTPEGTVITAGLVKAKSSIFGLDGQAL